jgi:hypothetical protein
MTIAPPGYDPDYWAAFEARMAALGERARPTEAEDAGRLRRAVLSIPLELRQELCRIIDAEPALRARCRTAFQYAPARAKRVLRAAIGPNPACGTCGHALLAHRQEADNTRCCQPQCECAAFATQPADVGLPHNWEWPVPALRASAEREEWERWRVGTAKGAKGRARARENAEFAALVASIQPPPLNLTAAAKRRIRARNKLPIVKAGRPGPTGRALACIQVIGDDPAQWRVTDNAGSVIDEVVVTASGKLARKPRETPTPFPHFDLPGGQNPSPLDRVIGFVAGSVDRLTYLAKAELEADASKHESGALERLAAEVKRLAEKPAPTIKYQPPDIHVAAPIVPTPQVTVDLSTLPAPQVVVNVEPPKKRGVRVEVNRATGEKKFVPFDLEDEEGEGE